MPTFHAQIETLIGDVATPDKLNPLLTAGARKLIDMIPPKELLPYATVSTGDSLSLLNKRLLHLTNKGRVSVQSLQGSQAFAETGSIYSYNIAIPSAPLSPRHIIKSGTVYAYPPSPVTAPTGGAATEIAGGSLLVTTYHFKLSSLNDWGESVATSDIAGIVTGGTGNALRISWNSVSGATAYKIYYGGTSQTYTSPCLLTTVTASPYDFTSLPGIGTMGVGAPLSTATGGYPEFFTITYPSVVYTDSTVTSIPNVYEHFIVLYAAIQYEMNLLAAMRLSTLDTNEDIELAQHQMTHHTNLVQLLQSQLNEWLQTRFGGKEQ